MINFDKAVEKNEVKYKDNDRLAPKWPFRMLLCGGSGCGKTNALLNMLLTNFVYFDKIYLYAKNIQQPKYQFLVDEIRKIEKKLGLPKGTMIYASSKIEDVIELPSVEDEDDKDDKPNALKNMRNSAIQEIVKMKKGEKSKGKFESDAQKMVKKAKERGQGLDPDLQNLVIFDDFVSEKNQHIIENYFVGSRHWNCSCIYLSQSYYDTPKIIRKNCTHFAVWAVASDRELIELAKDHAGGLGNDNFKHIFHECTQYPYHFMFIDKITKDRDLKYRVNFGKVPIGCCEDDEEANIESSSDEE